MKTLLIVILFLPLTIKSQIAEHNVLIATMQSHIIVSLEKDTSTWVHIESYSGTFSQCGNLADSLLLKFFNRQSIKKKLVIFHQGIFIIIEYLKAYREDSYKTIQEADISVIKYINSLTQKTYQFNLNFSEEINFNKKQGWVWFRNFNRSF